MPSKNEKMSTKSEVAIKVENLSKTFKIPHEKESTMKGAVVNLLNSSVKGYETFRALSDVNFEVKKGEFFGIIGRNGCGKSTLLKILAGIYVPDKKNGKLVIEGKLSPFLELGVGFNPELTGRENIFLGGTILGLTKKQIAERYDKIVDFSELGEFIDMKMKNYSSGMQVRLAFSLAINVEAQILLMDEVLAVGDTNFQAKCLAEFNKYREMGKTVVLVTHDVSVVQRYCDRVMLMRKGEVVKIGDAEEVVSMYMQQNISDEESRETEPGETLTEGVSTGSSSKKVRIKNVTICDSRGAEKKVFKPGEDLVVRVTFSNLKKIKDLNFGIAINNQENVCLQGVSTVIDKVNTVDMVRDGYYEIVFDKIPFRSDVYHVNAAIYGHDHQKVYDFQAKAKTFRVFSPSLNDGVVDLKYRWNN